MRVRTAFVVPFSLFAALAALLGTASTAAGRDPTESLRKSAPRGVSCGEANGLRNAGRPAQEIAVYAVVWTKQ